MTSEKSQSPIFFLPPAVELFMAGEIFSAIDKINNYCWLDSVERVCPLRGNAAFTSQII